MQSWRPNVCPAVADGPWLRVRVIAVMRDPVGEVWRDAVPGEDGLVTDRQAGEELVDVRGGRQQFLSLGDVLAPRSLLRRELYRP